MPGRASLLAGQYYAHPRNAFWAIIRATYGIENSLDYEQRCRQLIGRGVAVWDVLKTCTRTSSLDSDIDQTTIVVNDFSGFFAAHPGIRRIYFNGAMAEKTFRRHVVSDLPDSAASIPRSRLPSTSPANAAFSFERKLAAWHALRQGE